MTRPISSVGGAFVILAMSAQQCFDEMRPYARAKQCGVAYYNRGIEFSNKGI